MSLAESGRRRGEGPEETDAHPPVQRTSYLAGPTHEQLDRAVLDAYGWPHDLDDEEILARLLALNLARAKCWKQIAREEAEAL